ncbi:MAG: prepilin-type N-terminal cleavage/methylation domain-containing protein [Lachnospiraceae bacterium]|nr:prepilin-type N-terminal cleavage/methylation domain-containing protein [Lachnospiraceae bacterium]
MIKNKGYTLVELLVAVALLVIVMAEVGALMINSQTLYKRGFYEVNLQEEAQQIVQQIEDLLINASVDVQCVTKKHNGIESDVVTIISAVPRLSATGVPTGDYDSVTYKIGLAFDVNDGSGKLPSGEAIRSDADYGQLHHEYESLILARTMNGTTTYSTMAEGVRALHIGVQKETDSEGNVTASYLTNYTSADKVTITVELQNEEYSYTTDAAAASVFLRNRPNTASPRPTVKQVGGDGATDIKINVLRMHTYNLWDYVDKSYIDFKFETTGGDTNKYDLSVTNHTLKLVSSVNAATNWSWATSTPLTLLASKTTGDFSDAVKITVYTEAVSAQSMPLYVYDNMTAMATSTFPVTGICVDCAEKHILIPQIYLKKFPENADAIRFDKDNAWGLNGDYQKKDGWLDNKVIPKGIPSGHTAGDSLDSFSIPTSQIYYIMYNHTSGSTLDSGGTLGANYVKAHSEDFKTLCDFQGSLGFSYGVLRDNNTNAVLLNCSTHSANVGDYWKTIVDKCDGYIRVEITLTWPGITEAVQCYGYLYPQQSGTPEQRAKVLDIIQGTSTVPEGTSYTPTAVPMANMQVTSVTSVNRAGAVGWGGGDEYKFVIENKGSAKATNWSTTTSLGTPVEFSMFGTAPDCPDYTATWSYAESGTKVTINAADVEVEPGDTVTVYVKYTVSSGGGTGGESGGGTGGESGGGTGGESGGGTGGESGGGTGGESGGGTGGESGGGTGGESASSAPNPSVTTGPAVSIALGSSWKEEGNNVTQINLTWPTHQQDSEAVTIDLGGIYTVKSVGNGKLVSTSGTTITIKPNEWQQGVQLTVTY